MLLQLGFVMSDLPIHCAHFQVVGTWLFDFTELTHDNRENCGYHHPDSNQFHFDKYEYAFKKINSKEMELLAPNIIRDTNGDNIGTWTMVYDEGLELTLTQSAKDLKLFAYMSYSPKQGTALKSLDVSDYISHCDATRIGWFRSTAPQYGCFRGKKTTTKSFAPREGLSLSHKNHMRMNSRTHWHQGYVTRIHNDNDEEFFEPDSSFVETINRDIKSTWKATVHKQFIGKKMKHMHALLGRRRYRRILPDGQKRVAVEPAEISLLDITDSYSLPKQLDWRNVSGVNYMNPVMNQGACGSCYAVAAMDAFAVRLDYAKVQASKYDELLQYPSRLTKFSAQDVLSCSSQNQGCDGGYGFLMSKWSEDVGLVPDRCAPFTDADAACTSLKLQGCNMGGTRYRAANHRYVGGFYGASDENSIRAELVKNGPVVMSFEPKEDFMYYKDGIYKSGPNKIHQEWEQVDHAVLLIGYGVEKEQAYWTLQNSWGDDWGEDGYFRMARGIDESGCESIVVAAEVVEETANAVLDSFIKEH